MAGSQKKKPDLALNASVWLKDEERFTLVGNLDNTSWVRERLIIEGQSWQAVAWPYQIECGRVVLKGASRANRV